MSGEVRIYAYTQRMDAPEQQNATLTLSTSVDKMRVLANVTAACAGGSALEKTQLLDALLAFGVPQSRLMNQDLQQLLSGEAAEGICVARGLRPTNGVNACFISLIDGDKLHQPLPDSQGVIDYFDTKTYLSVAPDTPLMRRLPPTLGITGINVLGETIEAVPGKYLAFKKCKGSCVSPDDSDLLISAIAGHPVFEALGVCVDNTLVLPCADLDSGNIDFVGSVSIKGDVKPRVEIKATGDIFVKGTVENASLSAGGQIVIGGGVVGEALSDRRAVPAITSRLCAGGDIHALFLQQVKATAGQAILLQRYALHCHLYATTTLVVGERGGEGIILGGWAEAGTSLQANVIGSNAYIETHVSVGRVSDLIAQQLQLALELTRRRDELKRLQVILAKLLQPATKDRLEALNNSRVEKTETVLTMLTSRIEQLELRLGKLDSDIPEAHSAFIQVNKTLYSNTRVTVNGSHYVTDQEQTKARIVNQGSRLVFSQ
ncbi:MAG: hypothetical protein ACI96P_000658 [Candidatus Azotimanducaceae bacterium]|jgi:uncharacterized protein (DUF342 family)